MPLVDGRQIPSFAKCRSRKPLCAESRNGELRPSCGLIRGSGARALRTASRVSSQRFARVCP